MYKSFIRPLLFSFDSETLHNLLIRSGRLFDFPPFYRLSSKLFSFHDERLETEVFGLKFKNPFGLAAGFDKNAEATALFSSLGFGFMEIGTIVPKPQPGNPRPRIFRLPIDQALINRMGFPSKGLENARRNLEKLSSQNSPVLIAVNIGKNKETSLDSAYQDYQESFKKLSAYTGFFVINVSSPNTPELRKLQEKTKLKELLESIQSVNYEKKPLLVKIAPDLSESEIEDILQVCFDCSVAGIVACNTTYSRQGLNSSILQEGGLSGKPLFKRTVEVVSLISKATQRKMPIIAVGGISSSEDVIEVLKAGANLIEIYTSIIYEGPRVICKLKKDLVQYLEKNKISSINDIIAS